MNINSTTLTMSLIAGAYGLLVDYSALITALGILIVHGVVLLPLITGKVEEPMTARSH